MGDNVLCVSGIRRSNRDEEHQNGLEAGSGGLGSLAVNSVITSDLPIITAITLVTAAIIIVANLVVDLLYAVIDPRVRIS